MKARTVFLSILILSITPVLWAEDIGVRSGTWVVPEYHLQTGRSTKLIVTSDGEWFIYWYPKDIILRGAPKSAALEKHTDEDGRIWFKPRSYDTYGQSRGVILKISDSGYAFEWSSWRYSKEHEIKPDSAGYIIIYR